jgi:hypothetical protein
LISGEVYADKKEGKIKIRINKKKKKNKNKKSQF